jgi:uncharacterized protein (TIGR01319 family)
MSLFDDFLNPEEVPEQKAEPQGITGPILAVDIGTVNTRAVLLDVVEGMYRFVARGESPSTVDEPWNDALEGVYKVIEQIAAATGRQFIDGNGDLILPEAEEYVGVDLFVATASAGPPIKTVLVGLVPDVSIRSGRRIADSTLISLVETISLADQRSTEEQIDALLKADADLVLVVGGTDGGAVDSLRKLIDMVSLAYSLMDHQGRPPLVYAGNKDLTKLINRRSEDIGIRVITADNPHPTLDRDEPGDVRFQLASLFHKQKAQSIPGFGEVGSWTEFGIFPNTLGFARLVHILGSVNHHNVLGIDLGSRATTVAAHIDHQSYLDVMSDLGMGQSANHLLSQVQVEHLERWLTFELAEPDDLLDYVWNKSVFPYRIPVDRSEVEFDFAIVREIIRRAVQESRQNWDEHRAVRALPLFGTILLSGATLAYTPHFGWTALAVLDAIRPAGISRLLLDPYGMASALGTIAPGAPTPVVQVLKTGAFLDLGLIVSLSGRARRGEVVLRGSIQPEGEKEAEPFEVKSGTIARIPIPYGVRSEVVLHAHRMDIPGVRRKWRATIEGGELGLVIDARGRPLRFPRTEEQRLSAMKDWQTLLLQEAQV